MSASARYTLGLTIRHFPGSSAATENDWPSTSRSIPVTAFRSKAMMVLSRKSAAGRSTSRAVTSDRVTTAGFAPSLA